MHMQPVKTVMLIKRLIYLIKLALCFTNDLALKKNFYINLSSNPGHLNPWVDLIITLTSEKSSKQFWKVQ